MYPLKATSSFLLIVFLSLAGFITSGLGAEESDAKPMNVVFILADDLGWSDTELYGTTELYKTPNLLRLAELGCTFNRAYSNSPLCSPTRASILTGQTPARHGSTQPRHHTKTVRLKAELAKRARPSEKALPVDTVTRLDTNLPTLGKLMKQAGYASGHFGKWHLGPEPFSPLEHGFDIDLPHWPGSGPAGGFVAPWKYKNFKANYEEEHIEDRMAEESIKWMNTLSKDQPFFMNYWQFSVHAPFDAKKELIEHYRDKIDLDSGQKSATYAAMVHSLDDAIGSLLDALEAKGIADDTIIIFTSDNGGNMYSEIPADDYSAPTSNAPLRGGKASMREGGVRVPCIVVWPGITTPGSRSDELIQTSDFYTTLLKGQGIALPKNHVVDGIDITPALKGGELDRDAIFTYFPCLVPVPEWLPPSVSVHAEEWKLVRVFYGGENGQHDYKLYNLENDIGETTNLAAAHPERVKDLDRMIDKYLSDSNAVTPQPNPNFDPAQFDPAAIGIRPVSKKKKR
ncbi:sulfatase [Pelagicoccus mobilis]|uniref:Sulfatase n=1 Tax=Pelagicoccus mobilis TaxID=415221 RepID=A0A934VU01_9BACT|nr:sulfatase [Pelagicoccus mobilis]MBK1880039.1 sulfatase [Pelagicoccus mobilis]